ncbi:MAG: crossover junction endodeoxyribonuclease RuvC [Calditerrivibrio sp.]|uniref:crossover junction endodeoxyribonuclease RuvC n=1 Tax=Calditerrivibrio sp. TaxID=2792612 RepID=UPI003D0FB5DA
MIILGIDPGLNKTGVGVLKVGNKNLSYLNHFVIKTDPKESLVLRLKEITIGLSNIIKQFQPSYAAVEDIFYSVNIKSAILLGQTRGCIISTLVASGVEVMEYTALQIKKSVVGYGKADKEQVKKMVEMLLKIELKNTLNDASDALACAICLGLNLTNYTFRNLR